MKNSKYIQKMIKKIMLVDDDPVANFLHQSVISDLRICENFAVVNDGQQALQFFENLEPEDIIPELILLDLNMPVFDGFDFLERFQKLSFRGKESVKIIVLSSSFRKDDKDKALARGAVCTIIKPLTETKFKECIESYLRK